MKIEIIETWWTHPRRDKLVEKIGWVADGVAVKMWMTAFLYWKDNKGLIPEDLFFEMPHAKEFFECGLAKKDSEKPGIYVCGSKEYFKWYHNGIEQRREAGRARAQAPRDPSGKFLPSEEPAKTSEPPAEPNGPQRVPAKTSETQPSSSSSSSNQDFKIKNLVGKIPKNVKDPVAYFVTAYKNAHQTRYGPELAPDLRAPWVQIKIKEFLKARSLEQALGHLKNFYETEPPLGHGTRAFLKYIENLPADTVNGNSPPAAGLEAG